MIQPKPKSQLKHLLIEVLLSSNGMTANDIYDYVRAHYDREIKKTSVMRMVRSIRGDEYIVVTNTSGRNRQYRLLKSSAVSKMNKFFDLSVDDIRATHWNKNSWNNVIF